MAGGPPTPGAGASAPRSWLGWAALAAKGAAQAVGMLAIAWMCEVGSLMLCAQVQGASESLWATIPGWLAFVWISKRSAAAGWWRPEGAIALLAVGVALLCANAGRGQAGLGVLWLVFFAWAALWPWARRRLERGAAQ